MRRQQILVIEDEVGIRVALKDELEFEGFDVALAEDGPTGLAAIVQAAPDLIVLDLMLPGRNGFQICEEIRRRSIRTPIIVLTARTQEVDKVRCLDLGADDYVTKPFGLGELVARIRAVLRRASNEKEEEGKVLEIRPIRLDLRRHRAFKRGVEIQLTDTEFRILALLLQRAGEVITRDDFLKDVWGEQIYVTHRTVDTHVAALRKKIEDDLDHPAYTLWGVVPFVRLQQQRPTGMDVLVQEDPLFQRVMVAIVVNPDRIAGVNTEGAQALQRFLLEPRTQALIRGFRHHGLAEQTWWPFGRHNAGSELQFPVSASRP